MRKLRWLLAGLLAVALVPGLLDAQATGSIRGRITELGTERPVSGAQVFIVGTSIGTLSDELGRFLLVNVPAGTHTVRANVIGYASADRAVTLAAGSSQEVNIRLESEAVALEEIVVTGVAGATIRAKVPFDIATVDAADLPVPTVSAGSAIQGKVAGATVLQGSGRPGSAPTILLRGPTSINAAGRSQDPLYIVDGVILAGDLVDIDALDIESVEVIKGAAAASLYGSRAASGVIQIRTRRGANVPDNEVRYTLRSEYGQSGLPETPESLIARYHRYQTTPEGLFILPAGTGAPCQFYECTTEPTEVGANEWERFQANPWPVPTFDQIDRFFETGQFLQNYVAAEGRAGATNYHISFSNLGDEGIVPGQEGFRRNNFRVNLDQALQENLAISASAFYSRSENNGFAENTAGPLFPLSRQTAASNLFGCEDDPQGNCLNDLDRLILQTIPGDRENANPLYDVLAQERDQDRGRFLGSLNLRYSPIAWMDLEANASYDRFDYESQTLYPKGYRTIDPSVTLNNGYLNSYDQLSEALNASVTSTFRFNLGENIDNRTQFRYLHETTDEFWQETTGYDFAVAGVHTFTNTNPENLSVESATYPIRADGYFATTNFDIHDRYIVDALIRNDGSSLFGEDQRRQWYYRLAGAWRMSQEPWFNVPAVDELKFRYAYGTAGGRPRFEAQYETFAVEAGQVTPITLGNRNLRPEFSREQEVGLDAAFLGGRMVLGLTYANTVTEDQILPVPLAAFTGFREQWRNAGTLESNSYEASLEARLIETNDFAWSARLLVDRTRSVITELEVPPFRFGFPDDQGLENVYYAREGEELGTFYGIKLATTPGDLPEGIDASQFTVNDEGLLVWVGPNGSLSNPSWGSRAPFQINQKTVYWGAPVAAQCVDPTTDAPTFFCRAGNSIPDLNVNVSSSLSWKGLSVYALVGSEQGFDVFNLPLMWANFQQTAALADQGDVPEGQRKPTGYFYQLYEVSGLNQPNSYFVEDASYVKLRELALTYRLGGSALAGLPLVNRLGGAAVTLTGRNLFTWSDYRGFDPEVGKGSSTTAGRDEEVAGSAALARVDGYMYPNFRTWTLGVELNF